MFSNEACAYPCPRFVRGGVDPDTQMVQCSKCLMWFVEDEDPIEDSNA